MRIGSVWLFVWLSFCLFASISVPRVSFGFILGPLGGPEVEYYGGVVLIVFSKHFGIPGGTLGVPRVNITVDVFWEPWGVPRLNIPLG